MNRLRVAAAVALAAACLAGIGCGGDVATGTVSGTVSYDGKPIENGAINFLAADGSGSGGGTIKDGKYTATNVRPGNNKVEVSGSKVVGQKKLYNTPNSPAQDVTAELVPAKYNKNTELTFEVKVGSNEKNFDLPK